MDIQGALRNFSALPPKDAARKFLAELGYRSDKSPRGLGSSPAEFEKLFISKQTKSQFDKEKAAFPEWKSADLIFQYTDAELSPQQDLLQDNDVSTSILKSYIFISIELQGSDYARGKFSSIARQINRLFPQPVMVLIKHGDRLTIAIINRRYNKLDQSKDVLGKVTLIRDISITQPHRGHVDILTSLALPNLKHPQKKAISDFDTLHAAWEQILNVELLNQRFYRDLSNWYFWALKQVEFPSDLEKEDEKRKATGLIRLLTRLIFCWFLKEKDLVPAALFNQSDLSKLLKDFDPESEDSSTYYQAILQNLFFATLNQRMGKDGAGKPYRGFAADEGFLKNRQTYDINNLYRYEDLFAVSQEQILKVFEDIPFLNGGLFECLDRSDDSAGKKLYIDGFSRNAKKRPHVPNRLFFDAGETADLSGAYGDAKRKAEQVEGLLNILQRYKFTIVENTPIDQEIALDPELLGKVFENLLASYNEETKTTARKQTGSFYTPRPIVDYMVNESLKSHLKGALTKEAGMDADDAEAGLELLFTYTEKSHAFSAEEVQALINSIDSTKILDPACGSGAFPMGALHKLVYILGKLDPNNYRWKQAQLAKIDSAPMREELEKAFTDNTDDYGRKLYLIENCLYGADIQPIAIQITKLRFFISLVCDQKTNRNKKDNHGIRPLPNLETKFVAANSLIGLPKMAQSLLVDPRISVIEKEIESLYHSHFSIQRRDQKLALQKKLKSLRLELAGLLAEGLMSPEKAKLLADWDPFDPQQSANFFDPHWMFGKALENGFDVIIANPPYGRIIADSDEAHVATRWPEFRATKDAFVAFMLLGLEVSKTGASTTFIIPTSWLGGPSYKSFREALLRKSIEEIVVLPFDIFSEAYVDTLIVRLTNEEPHRDHTVKAYTYQKKTDVTNFTPGPWEKISPKEWNASPDRKFLLSESALALAGTLRKNCGRALSSLIEMKRGVLFDRSLLTNEKTSKDSHLYFEGDVYRYHLNKITEHWVEYGPSMKEYPKEFRWFEGERLLLRRLVNRRQRLMATFADGTFITNKNIYSLLEIPNSEPLKVTLALLNSKLVSRLYIEAVSQATKDDFPQVTIADLLNLPAPTVIPAEVKLRLIELVDRIISLKRVDAGAEDASVEDEIDSIVYKLYGLSPHEISFIESGLPLA